MPKISGYPRPFKAGVFIMEDHPTLFPLAEIPRAPGDENKLILVQQSFQADPLITQAMAAEVLASYPQYIRYLIEAGKIQTKKVLGRNLVVLSSVETFIKSKEEKNGNKNTVGAV